ncbi:MAG: methyltransferase type 11 [Alphaproteobacteria bacterium RIFOXYD12_FULL_60_8]|nr:MAG: methyltransferase type 11 [Alphaproteobacteria bacterium RIFOXYD12_FULL_60_8]
MTARAVRRRIRAIWPNVKGDRVLGVGFATPYLRTFTEEAERVIAVMPAAQGVMHWPDQGPGQVLLAEETELPLPDRSIDRLLLAHALESSPHPGVLLREAWRVLSDRGRLLVVAPNRAGLWSHADNTPFGKGQPYTRSQLNALLREDMFMPTGCEPALFFPPSERRLALSWAPAIEELGARWFSRFSGVLVMEASKQYYAAPVEKAAVKRARLAEALGGLKRPAVTGPFEPAGRREHRY